MKIDLVVHATHEAGVKFGGIGAVLTGLLGSKAYNQHVARTILVGPVDTSSAVEMERLTAARNQLEIRYYSAQESQQVEAETAIALIDGLLLFRQLAGPAAAQRAARRLGITAPN